MLTFALLVVTAAPASAGYYFSVPVRNPAGSEFTMVHGSTCGDEIEDTWSVPWSRPGEGPVIRAQFTMPAIGGEFSWAPGETPLAFVGRRTSKREVYLEYSAPGPIGPQILGRGTGKIVNGANPHVPDACGKKRLSQDDKDALTQWADDSDSAMWLEAACATGKIPAEIKGLPVPPWVLRAQGKGLPGWVRVACASAAAIEWVQSWIARRLAKDPPDRRFRELAVLETPTVRPVRAKGRGARRVGRSLTALLEASTRAAGLNRVLLTSVERAQGAIVFGGPEDAEWERRQMLAAAGHAKALAGVLDRLGPLSVTAVSALKKAGVRARFTRRHAAAIRWSIRRRGLPRAVTRDAQRMGADREMLEALQQSILSAKPGSSASRFPDVLASPERLDAMRELAKTMREFAARVELDPVAPAQ